MKIAELLMGSSLPKKDFFQITEVANLLNVKPHEIRYWESEFPKVRAQRSKSGQRIYKRQDVLLFFAIKTLVYEKKLTVAGAQRLLAQADEHFFATMNNNHDALDHGVLPELAVDASCEQMLADNFLWPHAVSHDGDQILETASHIFLDEGGGDDEFDLHAHEIYQQCADDLDSVSLEIAPHNVGEMLHDAIAQKEQADKNAHRLSRLDYDKALAILMQSKKSLIELLVTLDKYHESTWWNDLKS